jgi:hypothetical protein
MAFCDTQAPVTSEIFISLLYAVLHWRVLPNFVRKRRCTVTIVCLRACSSTQNAFSARVAILTHPAPLAATDVSKHPLHVVQWNLSVMTTYGATKNRPTYTGGQLTENRIFYMTTYIHSYNNYPTRIIILHTSTDQLWFIMFMLFVKSNL